MQIRKLLTFSIGKVRLWGIIKPLAFATAGGLSTYLFVLLKDNKENIVKINSSLEEAMQRRDTLQIKQKEYQTANRKNANYIKRQECYDDEIEQYKNVKNAGWTLIKQKFVEKECEQKNPLNDESEEEA